MRKEELRAWKEWERGCKAAMKADEERKRREGKEKAKRERVLEKCVFLYYLCVHPRGSLWSGGEQTMRGIRGKCSERQMGTV